MCNYQTWYHDPARGYVIFCHQCNHTQVGFGNVALTLNRDGFYSLYRYLRDCTDVVSVNQEIRTVRIPTPCDGLHLLLTAPELTQLLRMLDKAETEWQAHELLQLFQSH